MGFSDKELIERILNIDVNMLFDFSEDFQKKNSEWEDDKLKQIPHPLDKTIRDVLVNLKQDGDNNQFFFFQRINQISDLWILIIKKSIECLRFFDTREPFLKSPLKKPKAYGIDELNSYFNEYKDFEDMLYGSNKYYRDHVVHAARVWLMGIILLLENQGTYIENIKIGEPNVPSRANKLEKLSIWSLIALTHDLGYPLEKSQQIISKTQSMMKAFVTNPNISMDLSFSGVQNSMNDFVLRFMSSKMTFQSSNVSKASGSVDKNILTSIAKKLGSATKKESRDESKKDASKPYVARLQPKFYFKFQKSLEKFSHGTISAIIDYKLLTYFLESDFSINEDYHFNEEEARQFYIRREVLRSISDHTCTDIYHMSILSLAFLLILVDECQEWGRKRIAELYVPSKQVYCLNDISLANLDSQNGKCLITETFEIEGQNKNNLRTALIQLLRQGDYFVTIFRDGQDTKDRNFDFQKNSTLRFSNPGTGNDYIDYTVELIVSKDSYSTFMVTVKDNKYVDNCKASEILKMLTEEDLKHSSKHCNIEGLNSVKMVL